MIIELGADTHSVNVRVPPCLRSAWMSGPRSRPGSGVDVSLVTPGKYPEMHRVHLRDPGYAGRPGGAAGCGVGGAVTVVLQEVGVGRDGF